MTRVFAGPLAVRGLSNIVSCLMDVALVPAMVVAEVVLTARSWGCSAS